MRPALHFTAADGWINDPHGLRHWNGECHAFFPHIPERTEVVVTADVDAVRAHPLGRAGE